MYGQLAGALWGEHGIPAEWRQRLALRVTIDALAEGLAARHASAPAAVPSQD